MFGSAVPVRHGLHYKQREDVGGGGGAKLVQHSVVSACPPVKFRAERSQGWFGDGGVPEDYPLEDIGVGRHGASLPARGQWLLDGLWPGIPPDSGTYRAVYRLLGGADMSDQSHRVSRRSLLLLGGAAASVLAGCGTGAGSIDNASDINLAFRNNRNLTGSALGRAADVTMDVPQSSGHASGSYASEPVDIQWVISYTGSSDQAAIPANLHGVVAGKDVSLAGQFQHASSFLFQSGSVSGSFGGSAVEVQVTSATGKGSSSVNVQGSFAGTPFSLYATLAANLTSGYVEGKVAGKAFNLNADVRDRVVEVTGRFAGPPALLGIIVGTLLYFLPGGIFS